MSSKRPVVFTGGVELRGNDFGRPVPLYASMLGVTPAVFRQAFSVVHPDPGHDPSGAEQQVNKAALLSVLAPYGVTNDELDRVANYYRFDASRGRTWPHRAARAVAVVAGGRVTAIRVLDAGFGYSYPPRVSVPGFQGVTATAQVAFTSSFPSNGHVARVTLHT